MIDVLVCDREPLFLDGLARVIRQDRELRLVAELGDGGAALAAIRSLRPHAALLASEGETGETGEPGETGASRLLAALAREALPTRVILFGAMPYEALRGGAAGVLSRAVEPDVVRRAVHRVARGEVVLCAAAQTRLADELQLRRARDEPVVSAREREVLARVAAGMSAPRIAAELQLSPATIRTHLRHLFEKFDAGERAQLVHQAMRRGVLD